MVGHVDVLDDQTPAVADLIQLVQVRGYCLSKPLPADEFAAWLRDRMLNELTAPAP